MNKAICLLIFFGFISLKGLSQNVDAENFGIVNLNGKIKYFIDSTNTLHAKDLLTANIKFKDLPNKEPSIRFKENKKNYWLIFEREIEIIKLIKSGESSKAIADKLCLSFETIKSHRKNIHLKLGINNMADLVNFAVKYGL